MGPGLRRDGDLNRLQRRQQVREAETEFVDSYVVEVEIRGRRVERGQCPVAEQLFEARSLEDAVGAAEGQRAARDAAHRFAADILRPIQLPSAFPPPAFPIPEPRPPIR